MTERMIVGDNVDIKVGIVEPLTVREHELIEIARDIPLSFVQVFL